MSRAGMYEQGETCRPTVTSAAATYSSHLYSCVSTLFRRRTWGEENFVGLLGCWLLGSVITEAVRGYLRIGTRMILVTGELVTGELSDSSDRS